MMKPLRKNYLRPLREEDFKFPRTEQPDTKRIPWETESNSLPPVRWEKATAGAVAFAVTMALVVIALDILGVIQ